jgi:hypothetical protein
MYAMRADSAFACQERLQLGSRLSAALGLLRKVKERSDLAGLVSELDRKVDEPSDLKRRSCEVNRSVSPARDVTVLAAAVIRENDPLVLALPQVVPDELVNELVGEML